LPLLVEVAFEVLVERILGAFDGMVLRLLVGNEFVKLIKISVQIGEIELALELLVKWALHRLCCRSCQGLVACQAQIAI